MADLGPQSTNSLPENAFPAVGAPWDANVLPVPRHPRVPPSPYHRPVPVQQHGDAGALQNAMVSTCNRDLSYSQTFIYLLLVPSRKRSR